VENHLILNSIKEVFIRPKANTPALDGMRALAILAVIGMHVNEHYLHAGLTRTLLNSIPPFKGGWVGVPMFFVLSGYLIGGQIWSEYIKTGTLKFYRFLIRRGLRIWPLYYFIFIIFSLIPFREVTNIGIVSNLLFLSNYWSDAGPIFGAWSLATEEHFYIIAPAILLMIVKFCGVKDSKFYRKLLWISLLIPLIGRIITWKLFSGHDEFHLASYHHLIYKPIHTNSEGFIIGMLIANYMKDTSAKVKGIFTKRYTLLLISALIMLLSFKDKLYLNFTAISLFFGALLWLLLESKSFLSKVLSHPFWFPIAKTSFGIYLIHVPVIKLLLEEYGYLFKQMPPIIVPIALLILTTTICLLLCVVLYLIIEKPFFIFRKKVLMKFSN
jgi:peptidoglycan/LPS O-acetylase OafA/YrhL